MVNSLISVPQTGPPKITFSKRQFTIGENLVANCTTSKAHPAPHITWLINGKQVSRKIMSVSNNLFILVVKLSKGEKKARKEKA